MEYPPTGEGGGVNSGTVLCMHSAGCTLRRCLSSFALLTVLDGERTNLQTAVFITTGLLAGRSA